METMQSLRMVHYYNAITVIGSLLQYDLHDWLTILPKCNHYDRFILFVQCDYLHRFSCALRSPRLVFDYNTIASIESSQHNEPCGRLYGATQSQNWFMTAIRSLKVDSLEEYDHHGRRRNTTATIGSLPKYDKYDRFTTKKHRPDHLILEFRTKTCHYRCRVHSAKPTPHPPPHSHPPTIPHPISPIKCAEVHAGQTGAAGPKEVKPEPRLVLLEAQSVKRSSLSQGRQPRLALLVQNQEAFSPGRVRGRGAESPQVGVEGFEVVLSEGGQDCHLVPYLGFLFMEYGGAG